MVSTPRIIQLCYPVSDGEAERIVETEMGDDEKDEKRWRGGDVPDEVRDRIDGLEDSSSQNSKKIKKNEVRIEVIDERTAVMLKILLVILSAIMGTAVAVSAGII